MNKLKLHTMAGTHFPKTMKPFQNFRCQNDIYEFNNMNFRHCLGVQAH